MADKVITNFYNTVIQDNYAQAIKKITTQELLREFELIISLFQSPNADLDSISKLYHINRKEILYRMDRTS